MCPFIGVPLSNIAKFTAIIFGKSNVSSFNFQKIITWYLLLEVICLKRYFPTLGFLILRSLEWYGYWYFYRENEPKYVQNLMYGTCIPVNAVEVPHKYIGISMCDWILNDFTHNTSGSMPSGRAHAYLSGFHNVHHPRRVFRSFTVYDSSWCCLFSRSYQATMINKCNTRRSRLRLANNSFLSADSDA